MCENHTSNTNNIVNNMSIEDYLSSLPNNIDYIDLSFKKLNEIPDLSRFTNLKELNVSYNYIKYIPKIDTIKILNCNNNDIEYISEMPNLELLNCATNNLQYLPSFKNLRVLYCNFNKLTSLPKLDNIEYLRCTNNLINNISYYKNIKFIDCSFNNIYYFHEKYCDVQVFYNINNPLYYNLDHRKSIKIINKFRFLYYLLKCKYKLIKLLWKIREDIVKTKYHPNNLIKLLENSEDNDLEQILEGWE